jgi:hypothetical protein
VQDVDDYTWMLVVPGKKGVLLGKKGEVLGTKYEITHNEIPSLW